MGNRFKAAKPARPLPEHLQRCTVQVRYTKGGSVGKWYSHGAYIAREAKDGLGFDQTTDTAPVAQTMAEWRREEDERFFRIIISPEFGDRLDLKKHVRETMAEMERDLVTSLEWVAVEHYNTDRPHVHVALRGKRNNGQALLVPPDYVKEGLRNRAAEAATNQLGYRTLEDVLEAQRREVHQTRYTGLDRKLKRRAVENVVQVDPLADGRSELDRTTEFHLHRRLIELERMGLAKFTPKGWELNREMERALRAAQKTRDRVQIMEAHGVVASAPDLPFRMLRLDEVQDVEGKILVHGQDEFSGGNFALVESVQGEMVRLPHSREFGIARQHGNLQPGCYVRVQRADDGSWNVTEHGDAELLLADRAFLRENATRLAAAVPTGFGGWLGGLRAAIEHEKSRGQAYSR
jgi:hypothetical protein